VDFLCFLGVLGKKLSELLFIPFENTVISEKKISGFFS